jgi:hypothetical protein
MQDGTRQTVSELIRVNTVRNEKQNRIEIRESMVDEIRTKILRR